MTKVHPAYRARERSRWTRPNAHHFVRPDWRRHVAPGTELAACYESIERKYRSDQARVPAGNSGGGQWTDEGGAKPSGDTSGRIRSAGVAIPVCIIGAKSLFGDGTYKVVYICADGRVLTREGVGRRIPGIISQPPR